MAKAASMRSWQPAPTWIAELKNGKITSFEVTPEDVGLERGNVSELRGGDAAHNAEALLGVLAGAKGAFRDSGRDDGRRGTPHCRQGARLPRGRAVGRELRSTVARRAKALRSSSRHRTAER